MRPSRHRSALLAAAIMVLGLWVLTPGVFASQGVLSPGQKLLELRVPDSPVFLTTDKVVISEADIDGFLRARIPVEHRAGVLASRQRLSQMLEQLILNRTLLHLAIEAGLLEQESVQQAIYDRVALDLADRYLAQVLTDAELESYEARARELQLTNPSLVADGLQFTFTHLLLADPEISDLEQAQRMMDLHERYLQEELDFDSLVERYSADPGENGPGKHTAVPSEELYSPIASQLMELEPGQTSAPFVTRMGWHMLRLESTSVELADEELRLRRFKEIARERHLASVRDRLLRELLDVDMDLAEGALERLRERVEKLDH